MLKSTSIPYERELATMEPEHPTLAGVVAFIEGAEKFTAANLVRWFETYLVAPGRMSRPNVVSDPSIGTAPLRADFNPRVTRRARFDDVPVICRAARPRVLDALRAFKGAQADDRFLQAAIFGERVKRVMHDHQSKWTASPRETDALAHIVLSLIAVDILAHREFYEQRLCICEVCGRLSFHPDNTGRSSCSRHPPRTESTSGFQASAATKDPR